MGLPADAGVGRPRRRPDSERYRSVRGEKSRSCSARKHETLDGGVCPTAGRLSVAARPIGRPAGGSGPDGEKPRCLRGWGRCGAKRKSRGCAGDRCFVTTVAGRILRRREPVGAADPTVRSRFRVPGQRRARHRRQYRRPRDCIFENGSRRPRLHLRAQSGNVGRVARDPERERGAERRGRAARLLFGQSQTGEVLFRSELLQGPQPGGRGTGRSACIRRRDGGGRRFLREEFPGAGLRQDRRGGRRDPCAAVGLRHDRALSPRDRL